MKTPRFAALAMASLLGLGPWARAQDTHYWTSQYGTRALLLGGAVIGSVLDLSGTYYNPGGLSLIEKPQTLIAAKAFQYPQLSIRGADANSVGLKSSNLGPAPTLIAGTIKIRGLRKHWFGYSYLARQDVKLSVSVSSTGVRDILPGEPGIERYVSQYRLDEKLVEPWFGLTWSYRVSKKVGIGVSQYITVRSHRATTQVLLEALSQGGRIAQAFGSRQYHYQSARILWKIGTAFDYKGITMGLTLTTPSLKIYGRGMTGMNTTRSGQDVDGDGVADDYLAADFQDKLSSTYRTPFSVAGGLTFKLRNFRIYASSEWFGPVHAYTVVEGEDFAAQSTGEILSPDVTHELAAVVNTGIGLEYTHSARFKSSVSFTTDYSARKPGTATNLALTDWDIYHILAGAELAIRKSALTLGLGFSFGDRQLGLRTGGIALEGFDGPWNPFDGLEFRYSTYRLILGFSF